MTEDWGINKGLFSARRPESRERENTGRPDASMGPALCNSRCTKPFHRLMHLILTTIQRLGTINSPVSKIDTLRHKISQLANHRSRTQTQGVWLQSLCVYSIIRLLLWSELKQDKMKQKLKNPTIGTQRRKQLIVMRHQRKLHQY